MNKVDWDERFTIRCKKCGRIVGVDYRGRKHKCKCRKSEDKIMELSCECGNESEFIEKTTIEFTVDGECNREKKTVETTEYFCGNCGKSAEMCERNVSMVYCVNEMNEYRVKIEETLSRIVKMEADNEDEAFDKVVEQYKNGEHVLDASDFQDVRFEVIQ